MNTFYYYLKFILIFCTSICFTTYSYSQNDTLVGTLIIDQLIKDQNIDEAKREINKQIAYFKAEKNYDTLPYYVRYFGSYTLSNKNWNTALIKAKTYVEELRKYNNPAINSKALKELAWIYDDTGQPKKAYTTLEEALKYADKLNYRGDYRKASLNYNLGYYASIMGDFPRSKNHYVKSLTLINQSKRKDYVFYQQLYNALGGIMWYEAKMDSCLYYFNESLEVLKKTDTLPLNKYYRPALLKMNLAIVSNNLGNNEEAINFSKEAITDFQKYIEQGLDEQKKRGAKKSQLATIDNLGTFYHTIGEFNKAEELITYSYKEKSKELESNDPNIIISKVILAQAKINTRKLDDAEQLLIEAIKISEDNPGSQLFWHAAAYTTLANVYTQKEDVINAKKYYHLGEKLQRSYLKGTYNKDFISDLTRMAEFYAKNNNHKKAEDLINEVYTFIKNGSLKNSVQDFISTSTIARAYFEMGDYKKAIRYSDEVINYLPQKKKTTDSILIQYSKPIALLINAKSHYKLEQHPTENTLKKLLSKIETGIQIIEQRKATIESSEDIRLLISQNNELFNFAKKLRLDLFNLTNKETYLDDVINLHESSLYNRIRSRLNIKNNIIFANLPEKIINREKTIRKTLSVSLKNSNTIEDFFEIQAQWSVFKDSLKQYYPKYYKMRFAIVDESLTSLQENIPANTTVVRYLFIENDLYAFIVTSTEKSMVKLDTKELKGEILKLDENQYDISIISTIYQKLYNQLWQPFESKINSENVIIIPDADLFNLSFETLTPNRIKSFKELASNSLLAKYNISYNYSLLLLDTKRKTIDYSNNIIAFTPEFNEEMKANYKLAITDSLSLDKQYLTLLPQPFSIDLANNISKAYNGTSFLNERASKQVFTQNAKEHKIIHIGTHAESNNISPELSRLVFAKNSNDPESINDNYLYSYEIYNQNLNAQLAILTACETGKPSYQAGEGMISLAHAFNYAGSESILTSLWKIDEQSSMKIIKLFYENLANGDSKDKALQKAKLSYINNAKGRTAAPIYWAGLVLIGDSSSISISTKNDFSILIYILIPLCLFFVAFMILRRKKYKI